MAELILTEGEEKADSWLELDDASLGKVIKALMLKFKDICTEQERLYWYSAAIILCSAAAETNADVMKQTIAGLTIKGKPFGSWAVTVKRLK
ncbi:MAG: hypothetical protein Q8O55_02260 [Dehalococcoidales bacterium]|nr:hypothetical protein [Dehalococcoidales bacterium]